jgi:trimethylamine--corrinoid protein Co-methyltransferase
VRRSKSKDQPRKHNYTNLEHLFSPQAILSDDCINQIHENALGLLEEIGILILLPEAIDLLKKEGATVNNDGLVAIPRDLVLNSIQLAPKRYLLRAPNPKNNLDIRLGRQFFSSSGGCPNAHDRIRGRRPGCKESFRDAVQLQQSFDIIHKLSPAPEPQDVPIQLRHYTILQTQLENADKPLAVYARGRAQTEQIFELIKESLQITETDFQLSPYCSTVINTNSPRLIDIPMALGLIDFARSGQLSIITPFCLAGAMAPITVVGALTLQHTEVLAGLTLSQIAKPGAPIMYGGFGSNVDMRSGAPAFGTPTHVQMTLGTGQLARLLGLPWRSAAGSAANIHDMQASGENTLGLMATAMAQTTLTLHAAGWLEGGLTFGYEKFINDIEVLQVFGHLSKGIDQTAEALSTDPIREVLPGGHFFETKQTMARYSTEFYEPLIADLSNYGNWKNKGAITSEERATQIWQSILKNFKPPTEAFERVGRIEDSMQKMIEIGGVPIND